MHLARLFKNDLDEFRQLMFRFNINPLSLLIIILILKHTVFFVQLSSRQISWGDFRTDELAEIELALFSLKSEKLTTDLTSGQMNLSSIYAIIIRALQVQYKFSPVY